MHPVLGLIPHPRGGAFDHLVGNFFTSVGGQAVEHNGVGAGLAEQGVVDLVVLEQGKPLVGQILLPHAGPHVGVEHLGSLYGGFGVLGNQHLAALGH